MPSKMIPTTPEIIPGCNAAREKSRQLEIRSFVRQSIHGLDGMQVIVADIEALKGVETGWSATFEN
jgi:hypothetical protein